MYGFQWRHFGAKYINCNVDYTGQGIDQLERVLHLLKTEPFSRRIMMTDYNPLDLDQGVLECCHGIVIQFYVEEMNQEKYLSCQVYIRSNDLFLGNPINILSYSILVYIVALKVDMKPKDLIVSLGDVHIYQTHIDQMNEQLQRLPLAPAILELEPSVKHKDWKDLTVDDFLIIGYFNTMPSIKAVMAV